MVRLLGTLYSILSDWSLLQEWDLGPLRLLPIGAHGPVRTEIENVNLCHNIGSCVLQTCVGCKVRGVAVETRIFQPAKKEADSKGYSY